MEAPTANEAMLELLSSSTDGLELRRGWLRTLMKRFDAQLGASQNAAYDVEAGTLRYADNVSIGPEPWQALDQAMDGVALPDISGVEHFIALDSFDAYALEDMVPMIADQLWKPFGIKSSLSSNVSDEGRFVGHLSIFRTADAPEQFTGKEMKGENRPWQDATFKLMSATHAMLCRGPKQRGAMLFKPDGTGWMQNELPVDWASDAYRKELVTVVADFASGEEEEAKVHVHNTRIQLTQLEGGGETGILVVAEPMSVAKVTEMMKLSPMERLVSSYIARGATAKEVAVQMSRAEGTIKTHIEKIYEQLGISSRAELAALYESGLGWRP